MQKTLTEQQLQAKKKQAQKLIEVNGLQQKEAATHLGLSQKTISKWAKKFTGATPLENIAIKPNHTKAELRTLRKEAARLVINEGFTQKAAGERLGITPKTMTAWGKADKWNDAIQKTVIAEHPAIYNLSDFQAYLKAQNIKEHETFRRQWQAFKRHLNNK